MEVTMQRGLDLEQMVTSMCTITRVSRGWAVGHGPCSRASISGIWGRWFSLWGVLCITQWLAVPLGSTHWKPVVPSLPGPEL